MFLLTQLEDTLKKCSAYEVECTEQKTIISDLTEKMAGFKEKVKNNFK